MGRLIDIDRLCNDLMERWSTADKKKEDLIRAVMADVVTPIVVSQPTVDAVPVVRCWDCRFWSKYPGSSAAPQYHECMARMSHLGNLYTTAREYCSRGERKDGDNEQDKKS